jgi:hypothetical protein
MFDKIEQKYYNVILCSFTIPYPAKIVSIEYSFLIGSVSYRNHHPHRCRSMSVGRGTARCAPVASLNSTKYFGTLTPNCSSFHFHLHRRNHFRNHHPHRRRSMSIGRGVWPYAPEKCELFLFDFLIQFNSDPNC